MAEIQTVHGPIAHDQLGLTLIHEHVLYQSDDLHRKASIDFEVKLLREGAAHGIQTVVELTPTRRIDWLMDINQQVDINIIASTGYYVEQLTSPSLAALSEDQMVTRMVSELTAGIDLLPVKAGIIKVAGNMAALTPGRSRYSPRRQRRRESPAPASQPMPVPDPENRRKSSCEPVRT